MADDVYSDFIRLKLGEPLLISAEHGDNMVYNSTKLFIQIFLGRFIWFDKR